MRPSAKTSKKSTDGSKFKPQPHYEQCIAMVDYDARLADEISFRAGDVINVTAKGGGSSGYWEGFVVSHRHHRHHQYSEGDVDARGLFPSCFVSSNMLAVDTEKNDEVEAAARRAGRVMYDCAVCLYDYAANPNTIEMSFCKGDEVAVQSPGPSPGWWFGINVSARRRRLLLTMEQQQQQQQQKEKEKGKSKGAEETETTRAAAAVHALHLDDLCSTMARLMPPAACAEADIACGTRVRPLLFPTEYVTCDVVRAVFSFTGRVPQELSLAMGDIVCIHRRWSDGWWEGSLLLDGGGGGGTPRRGIFPSNYTIPNMPCVTPPFFCSTCKHVYAATSVLAGTATTTTRPCQNCARLNDITACMLTALDAHGGRENGGNLDLFAKVDVSPHTGTGLLPDDGAAAGRGPALLTATDVADLGAGRVKFVSS